MKMETLVSLSLALLILIAGANLLHIALRQDVDWALALMYWLCAAVHHLFQKLLLDQQAREAEEKAWPQETITFTK